MKKKLLAVTAAALSAVFAFSLAACNGGNETTGGSCAHTHTYSEQWSHNETEHWHACTGADCDEVTDKAAHIWDNGTITAEPTCTEKGEKTYTCTVCSATKTEEIATTEHTFSDKWESDETHHWHKCENCDEISGKAEHAYTDGVCVCGHIKPNTDPMPEFDPIDTLDELYNTPKPDEKDFTEETYGANYALFYQNAVKEYNEAQDMQKAIYKSLNENLVPRMLKVLEKVPSAENLIDAKWFLNGDKKTNIVDFINAEIMFNRSNGEIAYYYMTISPKKNTTINIENLATPTQEYFDTVFSTKLGGARFTAHEAFYYKLSEQERLKDLLTAITAKIGTKLDGNVQSFIRINNGGVDTNLGGPANNYTILNVTNYGYAEIGIKILASENILTEIENLNNGKYYTYGEKSKTFSGQYLDENSGKDKIDLPAAELIATPAEYRRYSAN